MTTLPILTLTRTDVTEFVAFWRPVYTDDDRAYDKHINLGGAVVTTDVVALMSWKEQGRNLGGREWGAAVPVELINEARAKGALTDDELRTLFTAIGAALTDEGLNKTNSLVWPVFLCHVAQPEHIPVYDVNVWLAWGCIEGWLEPKHLKQKPNKFDTYLEYRAWFNGLAASGGVDSRNLDRALMSLGQFIQTVVGWRIALAPYSDA
jgi:hypothetical protein